MRSKLGEILREERERVGLTQRELASTACVDRANISRYENGVVPIPHDVLCRAVKVMGSHKLRAQACFECQISTLTMPYLDLVDMHAMTVITVLVEELEEAKAALMALRLANKRTHSDLNAKDREDMEYAGEQVIDILAAIHTLLASFNEWYGFDVDYQAIRGYEKLFEKGYATRQSYNAWNYIA